jgi:glycine/D-amino acid oxidase-like deaminating enzyme
VYDYALMTEPLSAQQLASVGWRNRQGWAGTANYFHYVRISADNRILWGGYDVVYRYGARVRSEHDQRPKTFATLARQFFRTFPQLEGIRFSHAWGGAIDASTRFCAFFDTSHNGKVAYTAGFTGLGVGATRFGAEVMLDLLAGEHTERTALDLIRRKPLPFPPEPVCSRTSAPGNCAAPAIGVGSWKRGPSSSSPNGTAKRSATPSWRSTPGPTTPG